LCTKRTAKNLTSFSSSIAAARAMYCKAQFLPVVHRPLRVRGGCGRQADGAAGLPSAPEMPCAPRQLRLVPIADIWQSAGFHWFRLLNHLIRAGAAMAGYADFEAADFPVKLAWGYIGID
jgi:hypothetical protein